MSHRISLPLTTCSRRFQLFMIPASPAQPGTDALTPETHKLREQRSQTSEGRKRHAVLCPFRRRRLTRNSKLSIKLHIFSFGTMQVMQDRPHSVQLQTSMPDEAAGKTGQRAHATRQEQRAEPSASLGASF